LAHCQNNGVNAVNELSPSNYRSLYRTALEHLIGRKLNRADGFSMSDIASCEKRLKVRLPSSLRDYYQMAGKLTINTEHNCLYTPEQLNNMNGKLAFMEENQCVVFWGIDVADSPDPEVFQANNDEPMQWYSEECTFSKFIINMWCWQRGDDHSF
jgi:hypothetical protein